MSPESDRVGTTAEKGKGPRPGVAWALGLVMLVGPYLLLEFVAPTSVSVWARVYIAGAVGGACFELIRNHWQLEWAWGVPAGGTSAEPSFAPLGKLGDIGFLGRMLTGAAAAPTFIAIVSTLDATQAQQADLAGYLQGLATRPDTLAWGVVAGFAAPAVWSLMEQLVLLRGAIAKARLDAVHKQATVVEEQANTARTVVAGLPQADNGSGDRERAMTVLSELTASAEATRRAAEPL